MSLLKLGAALVIPMAAVDIELELAQASDAAELAHLARDLVEIGLGWTYRPDRIRALIRNADTVTLIARDGHHVAGFAIMEFGVERAHLVLLAVRPSRQRNGIARRLIEWLVESAIVAGMGSIHVELRIGNAVAFAFYRAMGFAPTLRMEGYYRGLESAVRMLRVLGPSYG